MNYLRRKIDNILIDWKNDLEHKPLVIKGARQVGKTYAILNFAKKNYKSVVYINFYEMPEYKRIIGDGFSVDNIIKNISTINNEFVFKKNETIIIFDEVQKFPNITTSLKFFHIDKRFDVICSGSLLGLNMLEIDSVSVGYKKDITLQSFDFEEFLWAKGYDEKFVDELFTYMLDNKKIPNLLYETMRSIFLDYIIVGGMPEAVRSYVVNKSFSGIDSIKNDILDGYKDDIKKMAIKMI